MRTRPCLWCGRLFRVRQTGGSPQQFCSSTHRHAFGSAARRWATLAVEAGLLPIEALKATGSSAHAALEASRKRRAEVPLTEVLVADLEANPEVMAGMAEPSTLALALPPPRRK
jgi:hypothetical protein